MSGAWTVDRKGIRAAVEGVCPGLELDDAAVLDRFAAGAWTAVSEPGDAVAGAVTRAYGAAAALEAVVRQDLGAVRDDSGLLRSGVERWAPRLDEAQVLRVFRNAAQLGVRLLVPGAPGWPSGLADLGEHGPIALWCLGALPPLLSLGRSIALVGARAATGYGEQVATEAASGLVDRGFAIVSGAAYGIDGTAHRSALASGGSTVAVLAGGLDRLYPSGHADLLHRIAREGAVLSELPCGAAPTKWRFLQRNRLIAAVSGATVVLEAGARSGSLNTASHAASIGRPLGAVPGSVFSATSAGCHRLLREHAAICVRQAEDMAELVDGAAQPQLDGLDVPSDPLERRILDALGRTPRAAVEVARRAGVSPRDATSALGFLALTGAARETSGGWRRA